MHVHWLPGWCTVGRLTIFRSKFPWLSKLKAHAAGANSADFVELTVPLCALLVVLHYQHIRLRKHTADVAAVGVSDIHWCVHFALTL